MGTLTAKSPAGYPFLPQEIIDMIIDHLVAERRSTRDPNHGQWYSPTPSLFSCTLVCCAWLPRSSRYLFEYVRPYRAYDWELQDAEEVALKELLAAAQKSTRLASNISVLMLPGRCSEAALGQVREVLTGLTALYLGAGIVNVGPDLDAGVDVPQYLLARYRIHRIMFGLSHMRRILRYLSTFSHIDVFSINGVCDQFREVIPEVQRARLPAQTAHLHIDTLALQSSDAIILPLLEPMLAPGSLKTLKIGGMSARSVLDLDLKPFFTKSCANLECLSVECISWRWNIPHRSGHLIAILPLHECPNLRRLDLTFKLRNFSPDEGMVFTGLSEHFAWSIILGSLPRSVKHIRISMGFVLSHFRRGWFQPALESLANAIAHYDTIEKVEIAGVLDLKSTDEWSTSKYKEFLVSNFLQRLPHPCTVIEIVREDRQDI